MLEVKLTQTGSKDVWLWLHAHGGWPWNLSTFVIGVTCVSTHISSHPMVCQTIHFLLSTDSTLRKWFAVSAHALHRNYESCMHAPQLIQNMWPIGALIQIECWMYISHKVVSNNITAHWNMHPFCSGFSMSGSNLLFTPIIALCLRPAGVIH